MAPKKRTPASKKDTPPSFVPYNGDEMSVALNTFIAHADNLTRAFVLHGFLRFIQARFTSRAGLQVYEVRVPSDSLSHYTATIDLRRCKSVAAVLDRNIVWPNGQSRPLHTVVGPEHHVRYWANVFEVYRYVHLNRVACPIPSPLLHHHCFLATGSLLALTHQVKVNC
jgi:hypothetical protein